MPLINKQMVKFELPLYDFKTQPAFCKVRFSLFFFLIGAFFFSFLTGVHVGNGARDPNGADVGTSAAARAPGKLRGGTLYAPPAPQGLFWRSDCSVGGRSFKGSNRGLLV